MRPLVHSAPEAESAAVLLFTSVPVPRVGDEAMSRTATFVLSADGFAVIVLLASVGMSIAPIVWRRMVTVWSDALDGCAKEVR